MSELTERLAKTQQICGNRGMGSHPATIRDAIKELERLYLVEASTQEVPTKQGSIPDITVTTTFEADNMTPEVDEYA